MNKPKFSIIGYELMGLYWEHSKIVGFWEISSRAASIRSEILLTWNAFYRYHYETISRILSGFKISGIDYELVDLY